MTDIEKWRDEADSEAWVKAWIDWHISINNQEVR